MTPFSTPALERALHAAVAAYVRQSDAAAGASPSPMPAELAAAAADILRARAAIVDDGQLERFERILAKRLREWETWQRSSWTELRSGGDWPMLTVPGSYRAYTFRDLSWATPMSMRNVDAECQAEVTIRYRVEDEVIGDA